MLLLSTLDSGFPVAFISSNICHYCSVKWAIPVGNKRTTLPFLRIRYAISYHAKHRISASGYTTSYIVPFSHVNNNLQINNRILSPRSLA
jgi:hypothetical protein